MSSKNAASIGKRQQLITAYDRFIAHKEMALKHEKNQEWRLAVFEWRECFRIRPRDEEVLMKLREAEGRVKGPVSIVVPIRKIIGHFNLAIRYWDAGKGSLALSESYLAGELLEEYGLPLGCALHNMHAIETVSASFRDKDQETMANLERNPDSVKYSYERATLLFDKRQLTAAYDQLVKCKELMEWKRKVKHFSKPKEDPLMERLGLKTTYPSPKASTTEWKTMKKTGTSTAGSVGQRTTSSCGVEVAGIDDDILCVKELIALYQQNSDSQRASKDAPPQVLPCLLCRFEGSLGNSETMPHSIAIDDSNTICSAAPLDECTIWWETLCDYDEAQRYGKTLQSGTCDFVSIIADDTFN